MIVNPPDIRTVQNNFFPKYSVTIDWSLMATGALDESQALATAIVVALGTNGLASVDDRLPDPDSSDRMGWWGDFDADVIHNAWPIGSKIWLESRSAIEASESKWGATQARVTNAVRDSLQPFIDHKIASLFEIISVRVDKQRIDVRARLFRGPTASVDLMYQMLWQGMVS